uniref:Uncharacterized protein n=1 Tax=viral metagenome TaxID=1070528 RepID=A0A6C0HF77_9ZZZZ
MAREAGLGLAGLFMVFFGILIIVPYVKMFFSTVSGFDDFTCKEGEKPCPEGYFCEQRTCVPILPRYDINNVQPKEE